MHFLIKSQCIFNSKTATTAPGIIEIQDGKISQLWQEIPSSLEHLPLHDYGNQLVLPSFVDNHMHYYISALLHEGFLTPISGHTIEMVAQQAQNIPIHNGWKFGIGWYASDFGQHVYPDRWILDQYTQDTPTLLISGDAHTIWLNSAALKALNINDQTIPTFISGEYLKKNNRYTGIFLEAIAIYYLALALRPLQTYFTQASEHYMQALNAFGITAVGDVALTGEGPDDLVYPHLYQELITQNKASVRISYFPAMRLETEPIQQLANTYHSNYLKMGGVKQFLDGVTSSHTAFLKTPYTDPYFEGDVGGPLLPIEHMRQLILKANQLGWGIRIHTVGDQAVHLALNYLREVQSLYPLPKNTFNALEHLEVMDPLDLPLTAQPAFITSVQPSHLLVGYESLDEEMGPERSQYMFPFRDFIDNGATLAFGTDVPVVIGVSPLETIYYAVARQTTDGAPNEGLMPSQRLTIAEALQAHTLGAALSLNFQQIGCIESGYFADITVLDHNILHDSPTQLLDTNVIATYIGGHRVWTAEAL